MVTDPDKLLALAYAKAVDRPVLEAVLRLDEALGQLVAGTREAMIGRIRLAWWRERLEALAQGESAPSEPLLELLQVRLAPIQVDALQPLVDGWEALLDDPLDGAALEAFSQARAAGLAGVMPSAALTRALQFWALVDFGFRCSDPAVAANAFGLAAAISPQFALRDLPRPYRVLVGLSLHDVKAAAPSRRAEGPRRVLRALRLAVFPPR